MLFGAGGADWLYGGDGNDFLGASDAVSTYYIPRFVRDSDGDADLLDGGAGDDVVSGGWGDTLLGGAGVDTLYLDLTDADRAIDLDLETLTNGGAIAMGAGRIDGFEQWGSLIGSAFADDIRIGAKTAYAGSAMRHPIDVAGGDGDDRIQSFEAPAALRGDGGNDVLIGARGSDVLEGGDGDDLLVTGGGSGEAYGDDGNDIIDVRGSLLAQTATNSPEIEGGAGQDVLIFAGDRADYEFTFDGQSRFKLRHQTAPISFAITFSSVETLRFDDGEIPIYALVDGAIYGTAAEDVIDPLHPGASATAPGLGRDVLFGLDGDDTLDGGGGADRMFGGEGADTFIIDDAGDIVADGEKADRALTSVSWYSSTVGTIVLLGSDNLDASSFNATLIGNDGNNRLESDGLIEGGLGNDYILTRYTASSPLMGAVASYAHANGGVTVDLSISGAQDTVSAGRDTLQAIRRLLGSDHDDRLSGDIQSNWLSGGAGDDVLSGGNGNDYLLGGAGKDQIDGGAGIDLVSYEDATSAVVVSLALTRRQATGGGGGDTLANVESVTGSAFDDTLNGGRTTNVLMGGAGDDILCGDGSRGGARDTLDGGEGADTYLFRALRDTKATIVFDQTGDRIDLSAIDADSNAAGDQGFRLVSAFSGSAGELRLVMKDDGTGVIAGDTDGDGRADFSILFQSSTILTGEGWAL